MTHLLGLSIDADISKTQVIRRALGLLRLLEHEFAQSHKLVVIEVGIVVCEIVRWPCKPGRSTVWV